MGVSPPCAVQKNHSVVNLKSFLIQSHDVASFLGDDTHDYLQESRIIKFDIVYT